MSPESLSFEETERLPGIEREKYDAQHKQLIELEEEFSQHQNIDTLRQNMVKLKLIADPNYPPEGGDWITVISHGSRIVKSNRGKDIEYLEAVIPSCLSHEMLSLYANGQIETKPYNNAMEYLAEYMKLYEKLENTKITIYPNPVIAGNPQKIAWYLNQETKLKAIEELTKIQKINVTSPWDEPKEFNPNERLKNFVSLDTQWETTQSDDLINIYDMNGALVNSQRIQVTTDTRGQVSCEYTPPANLKMGYYLIKSSKAWVHKVFITK